MNEIINTIQNHRCIRDFLDKDIDENLIDEILKAAQAMPNSINGQQTSVIVVKEKETKAKIANLVGNQKWVEQAPIFLVFVADFYKPSLAAEKNGLKQVIHESIEGSLVGAVDAGLAMGAAIISAESLGLGIVPIGGVRKNPEEIIKLLELPEYTFPMVGLAVGYPSNPSHQKPRLPFSTYKHEEKYRKEGMKEAIDEFDHTIDAYLKETGREKQASWSQSTSTIYQSVYYPKVYSSMKEQGFKNDK